MPMLSPGSNKSITTSADRGFTLIELVVVISLLTMMLFLALPRFQSSLFSDNSRKATNWIIANIQRSKGNAVRSRLDHVLHIQIDNNSMWISRESMSQEELQKAKETAYRLPGDLSIADVLYHNKEKVTAGNADILFSKKGYSSNVIIHLEKDGTDRISLLVEPFLTTVKMYREYKEFGS